MNYKLRRLVPNSISSLSLVLGVLSIFKSMENDFFHAALFIVNIIFPSVPDFPDQKGFFDV